MKFVGWRPVPLRLPGGTRLRLWTPYVRPTRRGLVGRPRGSGKRRGAGAGRYPVLERLGVRDRVTPWGRSAVSRQVVLCSSYEEAREQLGRGGLELDPKTLTRIAVSTGEEALRLRDEALQEARQRPLSQDGPAAGRRLRVSLDGGRARTRTVRPHCRKGDNGRRPFAVQWQEPRLVTIEFLDEKGQRARDTKPIYETSLGNADQLFALTTGLLRELGAHRAAEVIFVVDGAQWMWRRVDRLLADAGIPRGRARLVLDYYHATEHVAAALEACKDLSADRRQEVFAELRRLLLEPDGASKVIARLGALARGRRGKRVNAEVRYLRRHRSHMRYAELRADNVPIGSGTVESAIRRVLNLRFKSAAMFWKPDHLEPLLYLRAVLKAGHWDALMHGYLSKQHWLGRALEPIAQDHTAVAPAAAALAEAA